MLKNKKLFFIALITIFLAQLSKADTMGEKQMLKFQPKGLTWEKMLSIVKVEGKPGLIYFKSACGVCKAMEERFFSDDKAIKFIESNFVPFKIDIDKDRDGFMLSKQFNVDGFPTLVFINNSGDMLSRVKIIP
ncbi:thioredoxin family protein, partial [candidate division KSB1 bacterium]